MTFSIYGSIPTLLYKAIKHQKLEEDSGGDFAANYTYVKDVANGIYLVTTAAKLNNNLYHITSGELFKMSHVVQTIRKILPDSQIGFGPGGGEFAKDAPIRGPLSIKRVSSELGFKVEYPLERALLDYTNWLKEHV